MTRSELLAVAKPILFNTEMVREILDNCKTVTRRVVKPQPGIECSHGGQHEFIRDDFIEGSDFTGFVCKKCGYGVCGLHFKFPVGTSFIRPPYRPGDILYVRETWRRQPLKWSCEGGYSDFVLQYRADFTDEENGCYGRRGGIAPQKWHPSIHMPKEAARLFLRVTDVRVERLQDIDDDEALKEGCGIWGDVDWVAFPAEDFKRVWGSTIKPADRSIYGWGANPWVWVIGFEKMEAEK